VISSSQRANVAAAKAAVIRPNGIVEARTPDVKVALAEGAKLAKIILSGRVLMAVKQNVIPLFCLPMKRALIFTYYCPESIRRHFTAMDRF